MVDKLILEDDQFRLYLVPTTSHTDWVNFRIRSVPQRGKRNLRSRLSYCRSQDRLSENKATKSFRERDPEALSAVVTLLKRALSEGLI